MAKITIVLVALMAFGVILQARPNLSFAHGFGQQITQRADDGWGNKGGYGGVQYTYPGYGGGSQQTIARYGVYGYGSQGQQVPSYDTQWGNYDNKGGYGGVQDRYQGNRGWNQQTISGFGGY